MPGVCPIEMIVQIALNLLAVTYNLYNHFCPTELLPMLQSTVSTMVPAPSTTIYYDALGNVLCNFPFPLSLLVYHSSVFSASVNFFLHITATFALFLQMWWLFELCFLFLQANLSEFNLIYDFCSSDQKFACNFFQIPPHHIPTCCSTIPVLLSGCLKDLPH